VICVERERRAAFTPLQLTTTKARKIVQGPSGCGRWSGLKAVRRLRAATGARRLRRFNPRQPGRAKSFKARVDADAEAG